MPDFMHSGEAVANLLKSTGIGTNHEKYDPTNIKTLGQLIPTRGSKKSVRKPHADSFSRTTFGDLIAKAKGVNPLNLKMQ